MSIYLILSTSLLFFLSFIWSKSNLPNILFKLLFFASAVLGLILTLQFFGYIISIK